MSAQDGATLYIDGAWSAAGDGATFAVTDPATGAVIGKAADAGAAETREALAAASAAFPLWSAESAYTRADVLARAHTLMLDRAEELARLMSTEQGKPLKAARAEVGYAADFLSWFAEESKRVYGTTIPSRRREQRFTVLRQPVGVVAGITPWNYPVSMITRKVAPAIAAGCTVVLKPAEQTPLCAAAVFEVLHEAGVPGGVANLVTTSRPAEVGDVLLDSRAVRKLTFTGSTEVGKVLAARAAATMKRVSLELGGHAPFLVFDDADPVHAAKGAALVKFLNTGQACICPNRIYVQRSGYDRFVAAFTERVARLKAGPGLDPASTVGPLIDADAMAKMEDQVADARAKGASVLAGGERAGNGLFFQPTVLADVTPRMRVYREETFGPIAALIPFDDEDEAIAMANDTDYGLASYLYTTDLARATRVSEALRFGIVGINDINPTSAAAPFGGVGDSGLGREGGARGIDEYLDVKLVGQVLG
ncbi:succinate-semialdehyde dehydrogenase (NADP(+)) [Prauserella marina]|uniref:Succinate-semialdehyde dehydrogenase / glutarate-semialdehyde dehydrogenase n=1 Tax=Prauserella marina TaxID=530584 RepID=A0A222VPW1_9PSEU|nr:NAD-dependent succinate-semialdehyde dehydrogenase [Prauserella marina]ASR35955.1 succinate-semialdehyde dehydrogenase (NADP(+)) [Prauserella marina]PWV84113.1 succinate-semialdehyde dehydrogenase/glutarate-semialdehyde dehydrogenase [Prauserella marina]SDC30039.1 succinate-semialdehyde dehydrogenase / glutarate-semialdehyde dehydrogenase [Prauserella marina]